MVGVVIDSPHNESHRLSRNRKSKLKVLKLIPVILAFLSMRKSYNSLNIILDWLKISKLSKFTLNLVRVDSPPLCGENNWLAIRI